jgi:uncharacterized protein (DUF2384 family)
VNCTTPVLRLRRDRLLHAARKRFADDAAANAWVKSPNDALDGQAPQDLVDTLDGLERALALLDEG